ncbi:MAG TPA: DUF4327 family protein [Coleofasciculaceae cyanobacterium]
MIQPTHYSIEVIQNQVRHLLKRNLISRQQPIYTLCNYIPAREWIYFERELEEHDFLLRDRIVDLIPNEDWEND